jgi:hypothetical protein
MFPTVALCLESVPNKTTFENNIIIHLYRSAISYFKYIIGSEKCKQAISCIFHVFLNYQSRLAPFAACGFKYIFPPKLCLTLERVLL